MPEWLTTEEAAELLGYHAEVVRRMLRNGKLAGKRFGPAWMVSARSVAAYKAATRGLARNDPRRGRVE